LHEPHRTKRVHPCRTTQKPSITFCESLGGGVGAGPESHGESAINVQPTITRNTDPEVIEKRNAALAGRYSVGRDSGDDGE
jgi:5-oxoprolinase (ATP-hydrolysing)